MTYNFSERAKLVFTPRDFYTNERLSFPAEAVKVISGRLSQRRRGLHAVVEIYGKRYKVYGASCGLPCFCDARIKSL